MTPTIHAICVNCGRTGEWKRLRHDPPNAVTAKMSHCDKCHDGDFEYVHMYDLDGKEILPS